MATRFDPALVQAGPPHVRRAVSLFSKGDLQQLLCEAMAALERLDDHCFEMGEQLKGWAHNDPSEPEAAVSVLSVNHPTLWSASAQPARDEDQVENTLPATFNLEEWQWTEEGSRGHRGLSLENMDKGALQQALCQCLLELQVAQTHVDKMVLRLQEACRGILSTN